MAWLGIVAALGCDSQSEVREVSVTSPDGELTITLATDVEGAMSYSVLRNGDLMVGMSPLGLVATTHDLSSGVSLGAPTSVSIDETYDMPTGKRSARRVLGNQVVVPIRDDDGARAELVLRAHDDGVAFRYRLLGEGDAEVQSERTGFAIPGRGRVLTRAYDGGDAVYVPTAGEYQQPPVTLELGEPIDRTGFAFPALFEVEADETYLMVTEADLSRSYCATRLDETPDEDIYRIRFPDEREGRGVGAVRPTASLPFSTPWRVIAVGDLETIVESTIVDDLSTPSTLEDASWIAPGRAAWSWFSQETGTPELQSEYIRFASDFHWEYVLIDAKWDQWEDAEQEIRNLVAEADAAGVKLLLWYNSGGAHTPSPLETPLNRMIEPSRRDEMAKIADWGIAGIKVDFFNSDKQDRIDQYLGILEDAADFRLLVNFHGATIPRGWQRTYPHLMTHEAVNGAEVYKFAAVQGAPDALTNVQHALLRNVIGSMDYTPVVFESALTVVGLPYAHSLALAVVFESGIQHFADRADSNTEVGYRAVFAEYPFAGDFLSTVPIAWEDTRLVSGDIDTHVILARRKGEHWYLGGVHAADATREYALELAFLEAGTSYDVVLIEQGESERALIQTTRALVGGEPFVIELQPDGGFVATLSAR